MFQEFEIFGKVFGDTNTQMSVKSLNHWVLFIMKYSYTVDQCLYFSEIMMYKKVRKTIDGN